MRVPIKAKDPFKLKICPMLDIQKGKSIRLNHCLIGREFTYEGGLEKIRYLDKEPKQKASIGAEDPQSLPLLKDQSKSFD